MGNPQPMTREEAIDAFRTFIQDHIDEWGAKPQGFDERWNEMPSVRRGSDIGKKFQELDAFQTLTSLHTLDGEHVMVEHGISYIILHDPDLKNEHEEALKTRKKELREVLGDFIKDNLEKWGGDHPAVLTSEYPSLERVSPEKQASTEVGDKLRNLPEFKAACNLGLIESSHGIITLQDPELRNIAAGTVEVVDAIPPEVSEAAALASATDASQELTTDYNRSLQ